MLEVQGRPTRILVVLQTDVALVRAGTAVRIVGMLFGRDGITFLVVGHLDAVQVDEGRGPSKVISSVFHSPVGLRGRASALVNV